MRVMCDSGVRGLARGWACRVEDFWVRVAVLDGSVAGDVAATSRA